MSLTLTTAPTWEPIEIEEAKAHLRVTHEDHDDLIEGLIVAAREQAENITSRAIVAKSYTESRDGFWCGGLELKHPICRSVTSIIYDTTAGVATTVTASDYVVTTDQWGAGRITLADGYSWPTARSQAGSVRILYAAGYASAEAVPRVLRQAMLLLIGGWYTQTEGAIVGNIITEIPNGIRAMLAPYRWRATQ